MAAPAAVAPPPGHPRFAHIDALRAIAALCVVVAHTAVFGGFASHAWTTALLSGLTVGVPIFFVISGFLLYRPFLAAQVLGAPPTTTRAYFWRRALRIIPAYWLALTVLGLWAHLHGVFTHDWWRYYLFLQVYSPRTLYGGILPAWTLCVEVTFYILLPLFAATMGRAARGASRRGRLHAELSVLAVLAVASLVLRTIDLSGPRTVLDNTLLENFDWFALGMALAVLSVAVEAGEALGSVSRVVMRRALWCWAAALAIYVLVARLFPSATVQVRGIFFQTAWGGLAVHVGFGLIAALLVAPAVFVRERSAPARMLAWPALAWLGLVSYGIYLWHDPLLGKLLQHGAYSWWPHHPFLVLTVATVVVAVVAAAVSYYAFERPILAYKNLRPARRAEPAAPARRALR